MAQIIRDWASDSYTVTFGAEEIARASAMPEGIVPPGPTAHRHGGYRVGRFLNGSRHEFLPAPPVPDLSDHLKNVYTSEEDAMPGINRKTIKGRAIPREYVEAREYDQDECCEAPSPESPETTLKHLRKQAKRLKREIAAVKKQAKRHKKFERIAHANAAQQRADHELAISTFRQIAADRHRYAAADRTAAALHLVNHS